MRIIGITGSSGSGKSLVAKIIADELNAKLIVADNVVRKMQQPGNDYFNEIVKLVGKEYLDEKGNLDRKKIAALVFNNEDKRSKMNKITQKYIVPEIKSQINNSKQEYIVIDVPLLIESGLSKICDFVFAVISNKKTQINRICLRDKITKEEAKLRLKIQPDNLFYKKNAQYIIENEGEIDDKLMGRISKILQQL